MLCFALMPTLIRSSACLLLLTPLLLSLVPLFQLPGLDGFDASSVAGQRVMVCGASTGIGEQLAYQYGRLGAHVAIVARRRERLETVCGKVMGEGAASCLVVDADLASAAGAEDAMRRTLEDSNFGGELDVLVLNHIIGYWGWFLPDDVGKARGLLAGPDKRWSHEFVEKLFKVNILSYITLSTSGMHGLIRAARRSGTPARIVVVSSGAANVGLPKVAPYSATKHALHGFFNSLRLELLDKELPVTVTICPLGRIDTDNQRTATGTDLELIAAASPEGAADAILRAGNVGARQVYWPLGQGLHVIALLRDVVGVNWLLDRIVLAVAQ